MPATSTTLLAGELWLTYKMLYLWGQEVVLCSGWHFCVLLVAMWRACCTLWLNRRAASRGGWLFCCRAFLFYLLFLGGGSLHSLQQTVLSLPLPLRLICCMLLLVYRYHGSSAAASAALPYDAGFEGVGLVAAAAPDAAAGELALLVMQCLE